MGFRYISRTYRSISSFSQGGDAGKLRPILRAETRSHAFAGATDARNGHNARTDTRGRSAGFAFRHGARSATTTRGRRSAALFIATAAFGVHRRRRRDVADNGAKRARALELALDHTERASVDEHRRSARNGRARDPCALFELAPGLLLRSPVSPDLVRAVFAFVVAFADLRSKAKGRRRFTTVLAFF